MPALSGAAFSRPLERIVRRPFPAWVRLAAVLHASMQPPRWFCPRNGKKNDMARRLPREKAGPETPE